MVRNKVCAVRNCLETDEMYKFRSFYKIPTSEIRKSKWLKAIPYLSEKSLICDRHFSRNNFGSQGKKLMLNAVPSENLKLPVDNDEEVNRKINN